MTSIERLRAAIKAQDPSEFERALTASFDQRTTTPEAQTELAALLNDALPLTWHTRHEDLVRAMQQLRDPSSATPLYNATLAQYEYLAHDSGDNLARKCIWALADIGTEQSRAYLTELAKHANAGIATYAQKRLDKWDAELHRKPTR
ncbi:MAG: hypothetical protein IPK60_04300 [Sandaracinaceae bacterium]|nr:hypothetical protein [Sandaracinaceae bacterium]